jgi:hypothetical protein
MIFIKISSPYPICNFEGWKGPWCSYKTSFKICENVSTSKLFAVNVLFKNDNKNFEGKNSKMLTLFLQITYCFFLEYKKILKLFVMPVFIGEMFGRYTYSGSYT